ncbi:flavodoxin [Photobacterium iliopiscarium]|jgi:flavodoxin|uniref:Flavodoxin n=1 Tax=Photobacterium iliopiscarium TaxID=56192 RepID=A0A0D8PSA7_9GAMM|nr:flavodoxin [Photobacterium iliopiscarium]KJG12973.1 flavodoxin [Photobacterium iliopiscarium]KJG21430.1 flavodoxin [Photobacterium iliopiscarium]MCD9467619.1 flavodoxin [Photobacterium iliopiscarium]MCD9487325.1 flavodoxin [Photobacterium iliopiscarium]MCF2244035.1 flavodoxin [Photobacterium iliopiscarium]
MNKLGIFVGSVYGGAEALAETLAAKLTSAQVEIFFDSTLDDFMAYDADTVLVISSTTGQGEIPENLLPLYVALKDQFPLLPKQHYGVIALGDSSYGEDRFCGAGRKFDALLTELHSTSVQPRLDIDAGIHFDPLDVADSWFTQFIASADQVAA